MTTHRDNIMPVRRRQRLHRGMASVFAMLLLVVFGSLAAVMAAVAQANLRAADGALRAMRAHGAAESGLAFATHRLERERRRFVVTRGVIDAGFAERLWNGTWSTADGSVTVLPPTGYEPSGLAGGLAEALRDAHRADRGARIDVAGMPLAATLDAGGALATPPLPLEAGDGAPWFALTYEPVPGTPRIRVTSLGCDGEIRRTIAMEFEIDKRIEYAVLSPNRVMIGKNVSVEGAVGTRYGTTSGELTPQHGDPLVMRSDFRLLSADLDAHLTELAALIVASDTDGDGRLRTAHSIEGAAVAGSGLGDGDGDGFVDEFDLFLAEFDANGDGSVAWDAARAAAAGLGEISVEFSGIDDQLARLVDLGSPDRNDDGAVDARDVRLGYSDGVLSALDLYAKVRGALAFAIDEAAWELAAGEGWRAMVEGPVVASEDGAAPVRFEADPDTLREVSTGDFTGSAQWFASNAQPNFAAQVDAQLARGGTYTPAALAAFESVPFGSPTAYDYYQRPIYENMTFTDVRIPKGLNALFRNCTFVGTAYIETETDCTDMNWNYAGSLKFVTSPGGAVSFVPRFPSISALIGSSVLTDTRPHSNSIRFDQCTFLGSIAGDTPAQYTHWRNKVQITGSTRFFSDPDDAEIMLQPDGATLRSQLLALGAGKLDRLQRSSMMLPGWSVDVGNFSNEVAADPDLTPRVRLKGTIVAGVLDVRGTADVFGTLLMTFRPVAGEGPLSYNGVPEAFNTTIGYFGTTDGDGEGALPGMAGFSGFGEIRLRYDPNAKLPDGIPWPIAIDPVPSTYREGIAP